MIIVVWYCNNQTKQQDTHQNFAQRERERCGQVPVDLNWSPPPSHVHVNMFPSYYLFTPPITLVAQRFHSILFSLACMSRTILFGSLWVIGCTPFLVDTHSNFVICNKKLTTNLCQCVTYIFYIISIFRENGNFSYFFYLRIKCIIWF